ncbi:hypothetical protein FJT64_001947 [Amphibalanus amphitrite]|uniref:Fibronectin type-III domain-containing protein n=1 Tax=Amphibalanus amphitrite TaxID=1232801 RepID=A0A6A4WZM5_AMPAM|nr:hypothetical protein FJT64_001947 [Amphibalanus amphitrite]
MDQLAAVTTLRPVSVQSGPIARREIDSHHRSAFGSFAVPSAAPSNLTVTFTGSETVIAWSPLPPEVTNGRVTGYAVTVRSADRETAALESSPTSASSAGSFTGSADPSAADTERTYHVTQRRLALAGRRAHLRVRVAAVTAAGRGPFSAWWRPDADTGTDTSPGGDGDDVRDGTGGGGAAVTDTPLTVTATVPRHVTVRHMPTWLVAALCCVGLFALGAGVLALHCHRLRKKQSVLAGTTPELADSKHPPSVQGFPADMSLSQNTLWLRDELFTKSAFPSEERDSNVDRHLYVNGLSEPAVGLYASARVVGSLSSVQTPPESPRPRLHRSLGSARMARRLHSLGVQVRK